VCLAILAIQMSEWKNVVESVVSALGSDAESHACILEFLRVLPEEVTEGRKINLTVCGPKNTSLWASASTLRLREYTRIKV
jgi:hypothetical protein